MTHFHSLYKGGGGGAASLDPVGSQAASPGISPLNWLGENTCRPKQ